MFDQFCRESNVDIEDEHTISTLRLVWMAAFLNCYNYTMEAIRRDGSLSLFVTMSEGFRKNLDAYFTEQEAKKILQAAANHDQH